jgi:CRP-like cAMP-binding protein
MTAQEAPFPPYFPDALQQGARILELRRGDSLFRFGSYVEALYRVLVGEVRVVHTGPGGSEIVLQRACEGQVLAECSVCVTNYSCDAISAVDSRVAWVPMELFNRCLSEDNAFAKTWALDLARKLREQYMRYERLSLRNARDRILHYLVSEAGCEGRVALQGPLIALAAELGMTHETLYRSLAALEAEGLILREAGAIRLCGPTLKIAAGV